MVVWIVLAIGLWHLQRWAGGLVCAQANYSFGIALYRHGTAAVTDRAIGHIVGLAVLLLLYLAILFWFIKNRALFQPSPSIDRWIVIASVLVLAAVFVMEILWL